MRNSVLRAVLAITAVLAAMLMSGVGAGFAMADPEDPGDPTGTEEGTDPPPTTSEPTPTVPPPPPAFNIFDIPNTITSSLRDMFGRPLSVFGNGRVPGTHTLPDGTTVVDPEVTTKRKQDRKPEEPEIPSTLPDPVQQPVTPKRQTVTSTLEVTLPFSPPVSIPVPSVPVPGYEVMHWRLNLTDPYSAYSSINETVQTVNSILADAYAPFNPFPPPPRPEPTFRILQEEPQPVVEVDGGYATPMSGPSADLPVLQAPVLVAPPVRVNFNVPSPHAEIVVPAVAPGQILGAGNAGVRTPEVRGSVTQTGSIPQGQGQGQGQGPGQGQGSGGGASANVPAAGLGANGVGGPGTPPIRQGYPQYLRSARPGQLLAVAIPGLAGLIAITISGSVIGYRQANSGRHLRSEAARFMP